MPLTEAGRQAVERLRAEQRERWDGTRPLFDSALTKGEHLIIEVGCECWAHTAGDPNHVRLKDEYQPRGGIVLEVTGGADPETGEKRRAYRCVDYDPRVPLWRATIVLTEAQVDPGSFAPPNWARIRGLYRRMCAEVADRKGTAAPDEIDLVQDAARLAAVVGQRTPR